MLWATVSSGCTRRYIHTSTKTRYIDVYSDEAITIFLRVSIKRNHRESQDLLASKAGAQVERTSSVPRKARAMMYLSSLVLGWERVLCLQIP